MPVCNFDLECTMSYEINLSVTPYHGAETS